MVRKSGLEHFSVEGFSIKTFVEQCWPSRCPCEITPWNSMELHGILWNSMGYYTCQLSRIMRESHAWGLETSISRIRTISHA